MKNCFWTCVAACAAMLTAGCIKEEPKNNECDIVSAWVEGEEYAEFFFQPSQMRVENVPSNSNDIVFTVRTGSVLPPMAVWFELTPGATIEPASGSPQDFSQEAVEYTVRSEDGEWSRTYRVSFREAQSPSYTFSFEHVDSALNEGNNSYYNVFYEFDADGTRRDIWASGNPGVALINPAWHTWQFPTHSVDDGYQGRGVCLTTQSAGALGAMMGKPIAAGNLFIGAFNISAVLFDPLRATEFGTPIDREPVKVSGWYKYQPGAVFTDAQMNEVPGRTDVASIYAVFFRNEDAEGNSVVLDGENVWTSDLIVSKARVDTLPPTDHWTRFEMVFEGNNADPATLASLGYSMTLVFSYSKGGDLFEGAIGSSLHVDEVKVEYKEH